jgi:hypothetical protein
MALAMLLSSASPAIRVSGLVRTFWTQRSRWGWFPNLKGLMREDAISVLVQQTLKQNSAET